jgi:hypothetical protein
MNEGTRTVPPWGGTVAPGYEAVLEGFLDGIDDLGDGGGAFAAYVDGRPVAADNARPRAARRAHANRW